MEGENEMQKMKPTKGIRSSVHDEYLRWADGSLIDVELYSDYVQSEADRVAAMSPEEIYAASIRAGLPRVPPIEEQIDMIEVERLRGQDS